jgi:hypothetical protein
MEIRNVQGASRAEVLSMITQRINRESRFVCEPEIIDDRGRYIKIRMIRLKQNKPYCGNHPNACEFNVGGKHRRGTWLEGLDWVEFNDLINDLLDEMNVSANVKTAVCILRKGTKRRTYYGSHRQGNFWAWNMDEQDCHYTDYCGREAPISECPYGTPGEYHRQLKEPVKVVG